MNKKDIRQEIRKAKKALSIAESKKLSAAVCGRLLDHPTVRTSEMILLYHPLPDELDTTYLIEELYKSGKTILLPKVISDTEITLHTYEGSNSMQPGAFGISEPTTPALPLDNLSTIKNLIGIIPGMAFDKSGNRLGRGKGYYDRLLSQLPNIYKIGVCFPFQLLPSILCDENDIKMNEIITL